MKSDIKCFKASLAMLTLSVLSLIISFFIKLDGSVGDIVLICIGEALFWGLMAAGYVMLAKVNKSRKSKLKDNKNKKKYKPGIICFFSNKYAIVADITMGFAFIMTIIFRIFPVLNEVLFVVFAMILILAINMHCIFNGVNFKYIKSVSEKN